MSELILQWILTRLGSPGWDLRVVWPDTEVVTAVSFFLAVECLFCHVSNCQSFLAILGFVAHTCPVDASFFITTDAGGGKKKKKKKDKINLMITYLFTYLFADILKQLAEVCWV